MRSAMSRLLTIALVAVVAVIGSIAGRAVWESATAEDGDDGRAPHPDLINEEATKPKFEGELLGFFLGPRDGEIPEKFVTYEELCGSQPTVQVAWDKAVDLDLSLVLPKPFELNTNSLNTGVVACGDAIYAARWEYTALRPDGNFGSLFVARSRFKYEEFDVSAGRVNASEIGGVPAIVIGPLTPNGLGSIAGVIFPGESVTTVLRSSGVSDEELLEIAEIVAAELGKRR